MIKYQYKIHQSHDTNWQNYLILAQATTIKPNFVSNEKTSLYITLSNMKALHTH